MDAASFIIGNTCKHSGKCYILHEKPSSRTRTDSYSKNLKFENYWSLVKRALKGTYIHVEPFHLDRYLDEQGFRFNTRKGNDAERFTQAASQIFGATLTYAELTGAGQQQ